MLLRNFLHSAEGNFASMTAIMLPVLLGTVGVAVDVGTMTSAQSKLQTAVDAAVLAASRINDKALDRGQVFRNYLAGNLVGETRLGNVVSSLEPYTQGAPFNSENTSKFVVVFTDGENTVFGASKETHLKSDYGAYGIIDGDILDKDELPRLGTTNRSTALSNVNTWTQTMCTNLKAKNVEIFTVLLGADTAANRTLYSKCATTPDHYYPTSDVSELDTVFRKIATRIARLYVTN